MPNGGGQPDRPSDGGFAADRAGNDSRERPAISHQRETFFICGIFSPRRPRPGNLPAIPEERVAAPPRAAIRESIERRQHQQEFTARGLRSRDDARQSGKYIGADSVVGRLEQLLAKAKASR